MNIAIVGLGKMGRFYDALMPAKYLVEIIPISGRVVFPHVEEFIAYGQPVDFVVVASPTRTHFDIARKLLRAGYNVLVEKPICISSHEARELESLAHSRNLMLYQSTLERYNPLIKFLRDNVSLNEVLRVESYRYGARPKFATANDAKFDLGVHDVDLWHSLYKQAVPWKVHSGYGDPRREIQVFLRNGHKITLDLLNKYIHLNNRLLDFSRASSNNPILEMVYDLFYQRERMNERWSAEIEILERAEDGVIQLTPEEFFLSEGSSRM